MLLAQLAFFVFLVHVVLRPLMAAFLFMRPPRLRVTFRTPADWGANYRDVLFPGAGGITLAGWHVPSRNGAAVVLVHGHSGNRLAMAYHAEALTRAGFGVLMFDLRAHGDSGGRRFGRGLEAVDDVLAAVAFLMRQPDVRWGVGLMGVSVGGMLALQAAARNVAIRAVAVDGPILGTVDDLPPPAGALDRFYHYPLERYYQAAIDRLSGDERPPANTAALARLARRPILLISAGRGLEQRMTRFLFEAARDPKTLWEIPQAAHATGWAAEPVQYGQKLVAFFGRALGVDEAGEGTDEPFSDSAHEEEANNVQVTSPAAEIQPVAERTLAPPTAMMIAFTMIPLGMIFLILPYQLRWGEFAPRPPAGQGPLILLGLLGALAAGLFLHELGHLIGYRLFGRVGPGAARLSFGRAPLAPQIQCDSPMAATAFRRMLWLPGLALGIVPAVVAIAVGSWVLLIWGVWMTITAGGDVAALWAMRDLPAATPVRGHPRRVGCVVLPITEPVQNLDK
ncbi:MAG: alpha/beta fold hydrolase [Candidatus Promineofilum sp.]|nr:alpha/beta fold hydrolase [Promineifilum sp.]